MRWLAASLLCATIVSMCPRNAHASTQDLFGFGARSSAMGATGATFLDDYSAVYANPAGLSRARETAFTIGFQSAIYRLAIADPPTSAGTPMSIDLARGTVIGLTLPLPFGGILRDRIAIGLGFYTPTDVVVRGRDLRPDSPQFILLADRTQSVALQLGVGADLSHGIRIGAGFSALAAIVGSVIIQPDSSGHVGSRVDDQLVASYAPTLGASWDLGPFRLAAFYRGTLVARFGVTIVANDIGVPLPPFNIAGIAQYDPWQIGGEAGFVRDAWTLAAGATFKRWSEYPGPLEPTTPTSTPPPPPRFGDTVVFRAGVEHRWLFGASDVAARLGYFYEPTPAPVERVGATGAYLDNDRHVVTAGFALGGRVRGTRVAADVFGQAHLLVDRTGIGNTLNPEPAGTAQTPLRYGGAVYVLGATATVTF